MSDPLPRDGDVYSFRTAPYSEFAPSCTHRYGAVKILGMNKSLLIVATLDIVQSTPPSLSDALVCGILRERRFFHTGKQAVWGVDIKDWSATALDEMTYLGVAPIGKEDVELVYKYFHYLPGSRFSSLESASIAVEGEWRWANDHDALVAEVELVTAQ